MKWISAVFLMNSVGASLLTVEALAQEDIAAKVFGGLRSVSAEYGIHIDVATEAFSETTTHGAISGQAAGGKALEKYTGIFLSEFTLYPKSLVRKSRLRRIVLCE